MLISCIDQYELAGSIAVRVMPFFPVSNPAMCVNIRPRHRPEVGTMATQDLIVEIEADALFPGYFPDVIARCKA
jgi:hypothetical protein